MMMSLSVQTQASSATPRPMETATGWLAILHEKEDPQLVKIALQNLLDLSDVVWHEIAEHIADLEAMAEEGDTLAAELASRVFFHLEEPESSLRLALLAGDRLFQQKQDSVYSLSLTKAAIGFYIHARQVEIDEIEEEQLVLGSSQLQPIIDKLLEIEMANGNYASALGVVLEARELVKLEEILQRAGPKILQTVLPAITQVASKKFRLQALQVVAKHLEIALPEHAHLVYTHVILLQQLGDAHKVARVLEILVAGNESQNLMALQISFDLHDSGDQGFVAQVAKALNVPESPTGIWQSLLRVLTGGFLSELTLSFLHKSSNSDRNIMELLKKSLEERTSGSRSSILHNASVLTHAYLNAGTTNDSFLRDHLDWMKKASNWAKFSATASIGVVHAGHVTEAMTLLEPYLPKVDNTVSTTGGYAEGGSLYALGLVHGANSEMEKRNEALEFIRNQLRISHANEVISHGAALAVGLTAMGRSDIAILNELKELLDTDSAVAGEAAGIAMGMVLVGTGAGNVHHNITENAEEISDLVAELKNYARETQHEKIIRGIAMGIALMNFGQEENADATIEEMRSDRDPVMRYGAQYAIALAYCGTGSNKAIRILLHTAVSDVSDDVRMAAVIGLAFVLFQTPERVPQLVKLLLESFNPHVRYASCMAVGIAMAGTGDSDAIALLEPMLEDMTDYVRQGALMGTAMIYMQQSDTANGRRIRSFREKLSNIVSEKHQSTLTKMGAILSTGILDAGGRNCSLSLGSRNGFTKMSSAVGLALWLQHWHWYPMMHMFSLALTPTLTIGLNKDFKYPKNFYITCNAKPSQFAYPKKLEEKKEKEKKRVETVTLSITAKEKARLARKRAKMGVGEGAAMDVDKEESKEGKEGEEDKDAMDIDKDEEKDDEDQGKKQKKKREPEPSSFKVGNPARITKSQSQVCEFDLTQRYRPIRPDEKPVGVIILTDSTPGEEEELLAVKPPSLEPEGELAPPEPFDWTPPPLPSIKEESNDETETKPSNE